MRSRTISLVLGAALCCGLAPLLPAGEADGFYKPTKLSGYVRLGGRKFDLPLGELRVALLKNGMLVVQDNRIPVRRVKWAEMVERFRFKGIRGPASTTSPGNLHLRKQGGHFVGRTRQPLIVIQKGKVRFVTVKARLSTNLDTRIEGDTLTMKSPVSISAFGVTARGMIEMKARRQSSTVPDEVQIVPLFPSVSQQE